MFPLIPNPNGEFKQSCCTEPRLRRTVFPPLHQKRRRPDGDGKRSDLQSRRRPPAAGGFLRGKTSTRRAGDGRGARFRQQFRVAGSSVAATSGGSRSRATAFRCFSRLPYSSSDLPSVKPDDLLSSKIQSLCPTITGNVCCTEAQFDTLRSQVQQVIPFLVGCPACLRNFLNLFCELTCSPNQSQFINVTSVLKVST
nr:Niemann-Pick C1 protein-like [Ipomoea batatas]GMD18186.1 Niemann-Pick C1 protein-like [Ipomoea batatas]GMD79751.1 Niemann-Pick C1 protein-like [Ipomoea batatas]GME20228.1 Niemann-Pick C1 protein-like [Ipomoea batatas]